ncbi:kelch domain-containing protein 3 isoform X3 [Prionailurus viverrinus]|uniref:kelch domain-containing protein 3 isoform X3 n=1 Tax=Prionailurus viverrinus TaxID=61388 RepID=UPI001FF2EC69|nr:kelch domain-containing protein 3 isoform X3 [Prionailurus viverrinus]
MLRWTVHLEGGPRRVNHAAVAVGHRVYSFGGYCSGEDYETLRQIDVHIFNAVSLRWTKLPPVRPAIRGQAPVVPYMRYGHSTVLIDDMVFLWGGRNDTEGACNVLYAFDVNTHKWSTPRVSGTVPGARDGHSACVLGKTMYIFGGYEQLVYTSDMSFEELLELQNKVGTKTYKQLVAGNNTKKPSSRPPVQNACVADKHRPLEMSAKVRVPFLRQVVPVSKKVARDPRFDDLSGEYNPEVFDKTYQFLNDIRAKEKELVKKQLKKHRSGQEHEKLQQLLQRMEQQELAQQERKRQQELRLALKQERRARAQQGHRPYFLKKSEQRQLVLAEKFKELKRSKKLESFLSRKRRRNAGKDRRHLPLNKE